MSKIVLQALVKKLEGDIAVSRANIEIYKQDSVGIGEHPEIVQAVEAELEKYSEAQDKLSNLLKILNDGDNVVLTFLQD